MVLCVFSLDIFPVIVMKFFFINNVIKSENTSQ